VSELAHEKVLHIDGLVSLQGITADLAHLIERAGPFGAGNYPVRLRYLMCGFVRADIVGDGHVRAIIVDGGTGANSTSLKTMAFRSAGTPLGQALLGSHSQRLHVAGQAKSTYGRDAKPWIFWWMMLLIPFCISTFESKPE